MEANNMKAMREALKEISCIGTRGLKRLLCELVDSDILGYGQINKIISAVEKARAALSAPPRNCDVGTAEEIDARWNAYCEKRIISENCMSEKNCKGCAWHWAQMPYNEEGGAK